MTKFVAAALLACATLAAQPKSILGTVADFKPESLEIGVKPDSGAIRWIAFGPETQVVLVAPGQSDLSKALPAKITDIAREDRVMVSFVDGIVEARRIVVISATAIARRDAAERLDWEQRGISGVVAAIDGNAITLENRTPTGVQQILVEVSAKTAVRRYAPDSVKFTEAQPSSVKEIAVGDQVRTRGDRNPDGRVAAEDLVFGTFLTTIGTVSEVAAGEMRIVDLASKKPLTIRLTADTRLRKMPDLRDMMFGKPHAAQGRPGSIAQMLQSLPEGSVDDLKAGTSVVVTSTRGVRGDRVTGIMVVANIGALLQMAQSQAEGASPMEALNRLHGGMMAGPGGFGLPAILQ